MENPFVAERDELIKYLEPGYEKKISPQEGARLMTQVSRRKKFRPGKSARLRAQQITGDIKRRSDDWVKRPKAKGLRARIYRLTHKLTGK